MLLSRTPGAEYKRKKRKYAQYGVLYYVIYAPLRVGKQKLTFYRLNREGKYELQEENPMWMPEIGLGIGTEVGTFQGVTREWLYWYDEQGNRYSSPEAPPQQEPEARLQAELQRQQAEFQRQQEPEARLQTEFQRQQEPEARLQAELQVEKLAARLRELGIDPDELD